MYCNIKRTYESGMAKSLIQRISSLADRDFDAANEEHDKLVMKLSEAAEWPPSSKSPINFESPTPSVMHVSRHQ